MTPEENEALLQRLKTARERPTERNTLQTEFKAKHGFVPMLTLADSMTPGRYEARLRTALETGDVTGMHPFRRWKGSIVVD